MTSTVLLVLLLVIAVGGLSVQWYFARAGATRTRPLGGFLTVEQIKGIAISGVVTVVVLLMFNAFLPNVSDAYAARGGPQFLLIVGVVFICLAYFLAPNPGMRKWLVRSLAVLMGIVVLSSLVPAVFVGKPLTEAEVRLEQEKKALDAKYKLASNAATLSLADAQDCTGRASPTITVGTEPLEVNKGGQCRVVLQYPDDVVACYLVKSEGDTEWQGPVGATCPDRKNITPVDVEYIKAVTPFKARVVLYPRAPTQWVRWKS